MQNRHVTVPAGGWAALHAQLRSAESGEGLRQIHLAGLRLADRAADGGLESEATIQETFDRLARFHDALTARTVAIAERQLAAAGEGPAPLPFCWLLLGSGARREQTVRVDQDNALLYADPADADAAARAGAYFALLAGRVTALLAEAGYPLCSGNVMASNPRWRGAWSEFRDRLGGWVDALDVDSLRFLLIAADFRAVYGEGALADRLRRWFVQRAKRAPAFLARAAAHGLVHRVPLGVFRHFLLERHGAHFGAVNVKEGAYFQFVHSVRVMTLANGAEAIGTLERIEALCEAGAWDRATAATYRAHFAGLLRLRLARHLAAADGKAADYVRPRDLAAPDRAALRAAMAAARRLQRLASSAVEAAWAPRAGSAEGG